MSSLGAKDGMGRRPQKEGMVKKKKKKKGWLECSETPISVAQQSQLLLLLLLPVLVKFAFPQNVKMRKNAVPQLDVDLTPSGQCVKSESLQEQKTDLQRTWK